MAEPMADHLDVNLAAQMADSMACRTAGPSAHHSAIQMADYSVVHLVATMVHPMGNSMADPTAIHLAGLKE